jgi:hypothetical protein
MGLAICKLVGGSSIDDDDCDMYVDLYSIYVSQMRGYVHGVVD